MAAFHFKYEAVLRQRQTAEDQCQRKLAEHLRHRHILHDQLARMQQMVRESKQKLGQGLVGQVDVERIREVARYSGQVTGQAHQALRQLAEVERWLESARGELSEAMRQRKAMEMLREKQYQQWLVEQRRRETLELDELAVQRYAREHRAVGEANGAGVEVSP